MAHSHSTKKLYNELTHNKLVAAERKGLSRRACAALGGVAERTYEKWLQAGRFAAEAEDAGEECLATDAQYSLLWREVELSRALWEQDERDAIGDPEDKRWQAHAWALERRLPDEYALVQVSRIEAESPLVQVNVLNDPAALEAYRSVLREVAAPPKEIEAGDGTDS